MTTPKQKITKYFLELTIAILVKFKTFQVIFFFISDIHWCLPILVFFLYTNPLTPGTFCQKMRFLDILMVLRLDLGQISINLVKNAFATRWLILLATKITFYDLLARKFFSPSLFLLFFSFCCGDWPFTGLASGGKTLKKESSSGPIFYHGATRSSGRKFCSEFFSHLF